jgi:hypothetical protein
MYKIVAVLAALALLIFIGWAVFLRNTGTPLPATTEEAPGDAEVTVY